MALISHTSDAVKEVGVMGMLFLLLLQFAGQAFAVESSEVLPANIRSASIRAGTITGLNQYYTDTGELKFLSDINAVELDIKSLESMDGSIQNLVDVLNQFGTERLGDQLNLGHLKVDADPEIRHFTPMFLYGWGPRFTTGLAVPIVSYKVDVSVGTSGSNVEDLRREFGGATEELDDAIDQLNTGVAKGFRQALREKGYKDLDSRSETYLGDIQWINAYKLPDYSGVRSAYRFILGLPTGPKPDADDLADVEAFGRWFVKQALIGEYRIHAQSELIAAATYTAVLPGKMERRVPKNEKDVLPDASQKQELSEDIGDTISLSAGAKWEARYNFSTTLAYEYSYKERDRYGSSGVGNSDLLERGTNRTAHVGKIEFNYDTVKDFKNNKAAIPATFSYELSQVLAGENIENQTKHELWVSVYF